MSCDFTFALSPQCVCVCGGGGGKGWGFDIPRQTLQCNVKHRLWGQTVVILPDGCLRSVGVIAGNCWMKRQMTGALRTQCNVKHVRLIMILPAGCLCSVGVIAGNCWMKHQSPRYSPRVGCVVTNDWCINGPVNNSCQLPNHTVPGQTPSEAL